MPAKIPLLDHMLIRWKGILFLPFSYIRMSKCFIIWMFCWYKNAPCPVALLAHSWEFLHSATVSTLFKCTGDDVILFYSQQEVRLQIKPTGRAGGTRTSPARMGYVHIHAVLSHTSLLEMRANSLMLHILTVKPSSQNTSSPLKWAMLSEVTLCALHVCFSVVFMIQALKASTLLS